MARIGWVFLWIGLFMLTLAGIAFGHEWSVLQGAVPLEGHGVRIERAGKSYALIVQYTRPDGSIAEARSRISSSWNHERVGQPVAVLYVSGSGHVRLNTFLERWFFAALFGGIGGVFAVIGGIPVWLGSRRTREIQRLRAVGLRCSGEIVRIEEVRHIKYGHAHPWRVSVRIGADAFESDLVWDLPAGTTIGSHCTVLIDPQDRSRYVVDLGSMEAAILG